MNPTRLATGTGQNTPISTGAGRAAARVVFVIVAATVVAATVVTTAIVATAVLSTVALADDSRQDSRIDPILRQEVEAARRGTVEAQQSLLSLSPGIPTKAAGLTAQPMRFSCWVHYDPGTDITPSLGLVQRGRQLASGRLTASELEALLQTEGVRRVEAARLCRPSLDRSVREILADEVHSRSGNPPAYDGYAGSNVVVGIVDTGIDVDHGDFTLDGETRLLSLWDQTATTFDPPATYGYGQEWTAAEINAGSATPPDNAGHGTHVAGIAVGSGAATGNGEPAYQYVGVAPEARLVVVKTDFFSNSIVDAVEYVFRQADAVGLPAVVNLSLGHQYGPHDGTETMDLAMDYLAGPGRVIVAAAGNEQEDGIHAEARVSPGASEEIRFELPNYQASPGHGNDIVLIDAYYTQTAVVEITVETPAGHLVGPVGPGEQLQMDTADGAVLVENDVFDPPTADRNVFVQIWDKASELPAAGTWKLHVENTPGHTSGTDAQTDFWIYAHSLSAAPSFTDGWGRSDTKLVGSPASADEVIAVGSYVTRNGWKSRDGNTYHYNPLPEVGDISTFSCRGPRRDGALKPEITAPGQGIGAALSSDHLLNSAWILEDGRHFITQGTSMAAPHVTGVVALLLDAFGELDKDSVMEILEDTARSDDFTGPVPNPTWGWGKVDALGATHEPTPIWLVGVQVVSDPKGNDLSWSVPEALSSAWFRVERASANPGEDTGNPATEVAFVGPGPDYRFRDTDGSLGSRYYLIPTEEGRDLVRLGPFRATQGSGDDEPSGDGSGDGDSSGGNGPDGDPDPTNDRDLTGALALSSPYPNPFSTRTQWNATLAAPTRLEVEIVDASGRRVARVVDGEFPAGTASFGWDGRDALARPVSSGVYWIRAQANGVVESRRVLLVR